MAKTQQQLNSQSSQSGYNTLQVLAAAVVSYQLNCHRIAHQNNKSGMLDLLSRPLAVEAIEKAEIIINYLPKRVLIDALTGKNISFISKVVTAIQQEKCSYRDFTMLAWAPKIYDDFIQEDCYKDAIRVCANSQYIGSIGQRVSLDIYVLKKRFLPNFESWIVTARDQHNNLIEYFCKNATQVLSGKISGRIKKQTVSAYHSNFRVTTLNYVRLLETK